jgi:hypothetical protein
VPYVLAHVTGIELLGPIMLRRVVVVLAADRSCRWYPVVAAWRRRWRYPARERSGVHDSRGDIWVADVLVSSGTRKIAFEVQWSAQARDEFERRQARYPAGGIRCAWFTRHERSVPLPLRELPVFHMGAALLRCRDTRCDLGLCEGL